jgi:hypothetical protein
VLLTTRVELHLLQVGRCRHLERVTLRGGRWTTIDFPALASLLIHPTEGPILYDTGYAERFRTETEPPLRQPLRGDQGSRPARAAARRRGGWRESTPCGW